MSTGYSGVHKSENKIIQYFKYKKSRLKKGPRYCLNRAYKICIITTYKYVLDARCRLIITFRDTLNVKM